MTGKITLIGFYNYDNNLFDGLTFPEGIDKDTFISTCLQRGGEFEVIYANPEFLKNLITVWGKRWERTFSKWAEGLKAEWNPIENYDRYEEVRDNGSSQMSAHDSTTAAGQGDTTNTRSSYDSDSYLPHDASHSNSGSNTSSDTSSSGTNTNLHTAHVHGNIGVTQASDMLRNYYDISAWNVYNHMADLFLSEFVIPIYD